MFEALLRPTKFKRSLFFLLADILLFFISFYLAFLFRFGFFIPNEFYEGFYDALPLLISLKLLFLWLFRIYHVAWRFFSLNDAKRLFVALFLANSVFALIYLSSVDILFPRSVILIDFFISSVLVGILRIFKRLLTEKREEKEYKRTLIVGANTQSANLIKSFLNGETSYYPVAIVSRDKKMINTYLSNIKVHGMGKLDELVSEKAIESAIIAKHFEPHDLDTLFERLNSLGIKEIKIARLVGDKEEKLKDIAIEDLLAREPKDLDVELIDGFIKNKKVLITGY